MTKENRFEGLMGAVRGLKATQSSKPRNDSDLKSEENSEHLDVQTSKHSNIQTSKTKKPTQNQPNTEQTYDSDEKTSPNVSNEINVRTSKHLDVRPQLAKSVNPDYIRTTVYLPKKLHKKLKAIAVSEEKDMSGIVEELIETWLESKI